MTHANRAELYLQHEPSGQSSPASGGRHRKRRLSGQRNRLFIIGSSPKADLRLEGDQINGCHAAIQLSDRGWTVRRIGIDGAPVLFNGEPVTEALLHSPSLDGAQSQKVTEIEIGNHRLRLFAKEKRGARFDGESLVIDTSSPVAHQQVLLLRRKKTPDGRPVEQLIESTVLGMNESYRAWSDGQMVSVAPAKGREWVEKELSAGRVVRTRLITEQERVQAEAITLDRDLRKPAMQAAGIALLLLCLVLFIPKPKEEPKMVLDQKSMDMIFNSEAVKKKRTESKKVVAQSSARKGGTSQQTQAPTQASTPDVATAPVKSEKATQALTSIRNSGLNALIGKIAKRANQSGAMIASRGVAPDTKGSGRAVFSQGTSTVGGGGGAAVAGETYKLGSVATLGKGGGATGVKAGTGLAGGTIGMGDVALVDEETVVEGGLDRDAIAEVIKQNIGQIRYCYERQLSSNRDLYGKLLVKWTIAASGEVADPKIDSSTLKSNLVEGCVLRRIASWKFPLPKGGTRVLVSYPFLFKALD